MKRIMVALIVLSCMAMRSVGATKFCVENGAAVKVCLDGDMAPVAHTALSILSKDMRTVLSAKVSEVSGRDEARIVVRLDDRLGREAFRICVTADGALSIEGGDSHGAAYGLLEVSRLLGVSPWEWWADAAPRKLDKFVLKQGLVTEQRPSVEYRGIFINDEDWGLMPWSSKTLEPQNERGVIGARTNERIFELLLRLRANYYWPAMHECTHPFFLTEGNREMAAKYGIYIGGSHCEPMACSTAGEWGVRGKGQYDYVNNAEEVRRFWTERVKDVNEQEIVYTIGMRGVHDGKMQGAKTVEEQREVLSRVIKDQRDILRLYVNQNIEKVPQVFIPYKEVLDVYNSGLDVPEDVTLMWCDDNYGYISHFPTERERCRQGGNGVYYHISYWGRPHDYLWLCTVSPALLYQQMSEAYERGIRKMWILNVGDIKPGEYQTELFMDMAWDMDAVRKKGVERHLEDFLAREFGRSIARRLLPVMQTHYRLAWVRRPEFMGGTRTEESDRKFWSTLRKMAWDDEYVRKRVADYRRISEAVEKMAGEVDGVRADAYFQLVKYPVQGAAQMNFKFLEKEEAAYDSIVELTRIYNKVIAGGKWDGMMDMKPRGLAVFGRVAELAEPAPAPEEDVRRTLVAACSAINAENSAELRKEGWEGTTLGYEGGALKVDKGRSLEFSFKSVGTDSVCVEVYLIPSHPVDGDKLRFKLTLDGAESVPVEYQTKGRSEEWKRNILSGQAVRKLSFRLSDGRKHKLVFTALDDGVLFDRICVYK